ncbi:MAG: flagellar assembly protein J [Candidatus Methanolliviera sp. GoM_asphalt]|nr:MAG: flagellar assembly protein J [Candidatus Methanolliviera sp. GoM_asphalt]
MGDATELEGKRSTPLYKNVTKEGRKRFKSIFDRVKEWYEGFFAAGDLLYMLTYMASISTAKISRDEIFKRTSEKNEYIPSKHIDAIRKLTHEWHYDYSTACDMVARKVKEQETKDMIERMGNAIKSGQPDEEFLMGELKTTQTITKNRYERDLTTLQKGMDAFTAILISTAVVSIILLLSVAIYTTGEAGKTLYISVFLVGVTSLLVVLLLFSTSPKEFKTHPLPKRSKEQEQIHDWRAICVVLAIMLPSLVFIFVEPSETLPFLPEALAIISSGMIFLPLGLIGRRDDKNIDERDLEFPGFIKGLGSIMGSSGAAISFALNKVDKKTLPALKDMITALQRRITSGLNHDLCWERFIEESGSNIIYKFTDIYTDSVELGGDAENVGKMVSSSALESVLLRLKRDIQSSQFTTLVLPLHAAMLALAVCLHQLLVSFSGIFSNMPGVTSTMEGVLGEGTSSIGLFAGIPVATIHTYVVLIVIVITAASIFACRISKGGGSYYYFYYASIFMTVAGLILLFMPLLMNFIIPSVSFPSEMATTHIPTNIPGGGF